MRIKTYIVRHPAGVLWEGSVKAAGETILAADGGAIKAYVHFKQVAEVPAPAEDPAEGNGSGKPAR